MAGFIPQQFIDELLARTDIVDIIDAYVPLKKAGKNHHACCPFHDEKTPSFTVSQQKQFYHCFGCGANGTVISFLMDHLHMGFVEVIEDLAGRVGIPLPEEMVRTSTESNKTTELYGLMELVTQFYCKQLRQHSEADEAIRYLKSRGISGEIAKEYELGFAPPGWDSLLKELGRSDESAKRLARIGAVIEKDHGGYYDRFRQRVTFPIRDQRGRAIGLGGRVLNDEKPKYLNSPETPIFHKGKELYGLYQARKALKQADELFVVEGYMDVIALAQFGVANVVASLGTAATTEHIEKMFRLTNKIVFCFDGDEAGRKAALRAMENSEPKLVDGKQINFMFLPQGEDPDSYIRTHGKDAFINSKQQVSLSEYLFDLIKDGVDMTVPEGRVLAKEKALQHLCRFPVGALRNILLQKLSDTIRYDIQHLETELSERTSKDQGQTKLKPIANKNEAIGKIRWSIRSLLHKPDLAEGLEPNLVEHLKLFASPGVTFLNEMIDFIRGRSQVTLSNILENWRDTKFENRLRTLAREEDIVNEIGVIQNEFNDAIENIINSNIKEFEGFAIKNSPTELSEEERQKYRDMQK